MQIDARKEREKAYHATYATRIAPRVPNFSVVESSEPRPWNAYWEAMWRLRREDLSGKRALVVGCGAGHDAIMLAKLGAAVDAFDLSPEMLAVAKQSSTLAGVDVRFRESSAEDIPYPDASFDLVFIRDILHHVDIDAALNEIERTSKAGALIVVSEIYCHSAVRWLRKNIVGWAAPIAHRFSGGGIYETEDEEPLTEHDIGRVRSLINVESERYFCALAGRMAPQTMSWARIDRHLATRLTGGRVLLIGALPEGAKTG